MTRVIQHKLYHTFAEHAGNVAIEYGATSITYADLDRRTNLIANYLAERYPRDAIIAVLLGERFDVILTMIGILKAGCVFMPLEAGLPDQRLEAMLEAIQPQLLISDQALAARLRASGSIPPAITLDSIRAAQPRDDRPEIAYAPDDRVYLYHTSGSTGSPKAIIGKNISLLHFLTWENKTCAVDSTFRCSQFTNVGFDVFLRDTLMPLCAGACLCIPSDADLIRNSVELTRWIEENRISLIHCVPSIFAQVNTASLSDDSYRHLKYILLAGEKVRPERLRAWFGRFGDRIQLINLYGPTETTLAKAYYFIQEEDKDRKIIPIGKPIEGAQLLIFDQNMQICDLFETGEVYIRTPFMSHGYYDTSLNTGRFVPDPLSHDERDRIYKTGDLGRLLPDGNIELLGRVDRQIKIRGIRVELEEIEYNLAQYPAIQEAVVVNKELSDTNQLLWAYVTLKDSADKHDERLVQSIMADLSQRLPQYMLPSYILVLDQIPRTANGKIDYSALRDPLEEPEQYVAPRDDIERQLQDIWKEVLEIDDVSVDESFFEKGGNSLNLMNLILRVSDEFQIEINLEQIALENTIERQAAFIKQATSKTPDSIDPVEARPFYPLAAAQRRIYFLQRKNPDSTMYNLPIVVELTGAIEPGRLEYALQRLVRRHSSLRTSFALRDNQLVQIIHDDVTVEPAHVALNDAGDTRGIASLVRPFALGQAPLMRVFLSQIDERHHIVVFDFHHSVFDGFSKAIFFEDFVTFYNHGQPEPLLLEYKDYAEWQHSDATRARLQQQESYWLNQLHPLPPRLSLPEDGLAGQSGTFDGSVVSLVIDGEQLCGVRALAQRYETTLFTVLLTTSAIVLSRASGQTDIAVGVPTSGRNYAHLEKIVGMFVNTLVLRSFPTPSKSLGDLLQEIKVSVLRALENQDYQFDNLVHKLNLDRSAAENPLFDVMFQLQQRIQTDIALSDLRIAVHDVNLFADFKLTFSITEDQQAAVLKLIYRTSLFQERTIAQLAQWFAQVIETIIANDQLTIGEILARLVEDAAVGKAGHPLEIEFDFDA
jgi:amino acid adenylation domain-containing protein